ncbi:MAG: hypothetical protein HYX87_01745 [Chloroflexi bacterium]|nr:hypothetical protein [Chloroflexota bacterium]
MALSALGEVIEANTAYFVAQSYELHNPPVLGSLVHVGDSEVDVVGVVCFAHTHSLDEGRRAIARGNGGEGEDVFRSHPELSKLLCTDFKALAVGHKKGSQVFTFLSPRPARVHGYVYLCSADEVRELSQSLAFLRMLLSDRSVACMDEVVSACLRHCAAAQEDADSFLIRAGRELATLMPKDFNRVAEMLKKARG